MGRQLRPISGHDAIKILCNRFGFRVVRQRGSHVVLRKDTTAGPVVTVVPAHGELTIGTLRRALQLAHVDPEDFAREQ